MGSRRARRSLGETVKRLMALALPLCLVAACGGGSGDSSPNLAGTYTGSLTDSRGTGTISLVIADSKDDLSGTYTDSFGSSGQFGGSASGTFVDLIMTPTGTADCEIHVSAQTVGAKGNEFAGSYQSNCGHGDAGSLDVSRPAPA